MQKIFEPLMQVGLPTEDFAIFGSGPLIVRNVIAPANDLDGICRGEAWKPVKKIGSLQICDDYAVEITTLFDGSLTFGNKRGIAEFDTDALIDTAEMIGGLPFVKMRYVIAYKLARRAPEERLHPATLSRSKYAGSLTADEQRLFNEWCHIPAGISESG